jgi:hypothetical protein
VGLPNVGKVCNGSKPGSCSPSLLITSPEYCFTYITKLRQKQQQQQQQQVQQVLIKTLTIFEALSSRAMSGFEWPALSS